MQKGLPRVGYVSVELEGFRDRINSVFKLLDISKTINIL